MAARESGGRRLLRAFADADEPPRRHPTEVTAARLMKHVEDYHDQFTPAERDALATVRTVLLDIAERDLRPDSGR